MLLMPEILASNSTVIRGLQAFWQAAVVTVARKTLRPCQGGERTGLVKFQLVQNMLRPSPGPHGWPEYILQSWAEYISPHNMTLHTLPET